MASLDFVRLGALGALLAGVAWIASFVVELAITGENPEIFGLPSFYLIEAAFGIALLGTLAGLVGLHARQSTSYGVLGTVGFLAASIGTTLMLASVVLTRLAERDVLDLLLELGLPGMLVGFVLLGLGTLVAGRLPRWCGVALIVVLPISAALGDYGGGIVFGLVWLALGYVLLSESAGDLSGLGESS